MVQPPDELLHHGTHLQHAATAADHHQSFGGRVVPVVLHHVHRGGPGDVRVSDDDVAGAVRSPVVRDLGVHGVVLAVVGTHRVLLEVD